VFASVFAICFLVVTSRLYFGRSSPADVQAGCLIGAGLLRIWLGYATLVDHAVLNTVALWPIPIISAVLVMVHPVALRHQLGGPQPFLNDTYWLMVRMLGFCSGYLMGFVHTAMVYSAPHSLPSSNILAFMRWSVGLSTLGTIAFVTHKIQLAATECTLEFVVVKVLKHSSTTSKLGVNMNLRNVIRVTAAFLVAVIVGGVASWGLPHLFQYTDTLMIAYLQMLGLY